MGLCKCPKRKVTNQFCFEHRVNVCENCMVTNHPKCIVHSYLEWLQDSDYSATCTICQGGLANGDCIRLVCYHVFHWACLDSKLGSLPQTTAPAGFKCPSCSCGIFPASNLLSPVADILRDILKTRPWARAGLGLPLLEEAPPPLTMPTPVNHVADSPPPPSVSNSRAYDMPEETQPFLSTPVTGARGSGTRRFPDLSDPPRVQFYTHDDENKYRRRSPVEWFQRWWKIVNPMPTRGAPPRMRRSLMLAVLIIATLATIIALMAWVGRSGSSSPELDFHNNPNIRWEGKNPPDM